MRSNEIFGIPVVSAKPTEAPPDLKMERPKPNEERTLTKCCPEVGSMCLPDCITQACSDMFRCMSDCCKTLGKCGS
jgi:hypothetical protein